MVCTELHSITIIFQIVYVEGHSYGKLCFGDLSNLFQTQIKEKCLSVHKPMAHNMQAFSQFPVPLFTVIDSQNTEKM